MFPALVVKFEGESSVHEKSWGVRSGKRSEEQESYLDCHHAVLAYLWGLAWDESGGWRLAKRTEPLLLGSGSAKMLYGLAGTCSLPGGAWMCIKHSTVKLGSISRWYATATNGRQERSGRSEESMQRWFGNKEWAPRRAARGRSLNTSHNCGTLYLAAFIRSRTLCYQYIVSWVF